MVVVVEKGREARVVVAVEWCLEEKLEVALDRVVLR